jgi:hypothetical protein
MATLNERMIDIKKIVIDPTVVIRHTDKQTVARYQEAEGLPAIDVFDVEIPATAKEKTHRALVLADGLHRLTAAQNKKGVKAIKANVHDGTLADAKTFAVLANLKHGLPLNAKARDEAIRRYSDLFPKLGYREVAKAFNCSHMTVKRALKPSKKAEGSVHVQQSGATTVPTGPKAAKSPADVLHAVLTVLQVLADPTVSLNLVSYVANATPKEVQERTVANFDTGGSMLQQLAARIQEQMKRKPNDKPVVVKNA